MNPFKRSDQPSHVQSRRGMTLPDWAAYLLPIVFVIGVVGLAYLTFSGVKKFVSGAPLGAGGPDAGTIQPDAQAATAQAAGQDEDTPPLAEGRVTVLLLGIDERESEQGPWRTDTMIVLTVDPATRTAGMISIPRDLWVQIPDYNTYDRINTAYFKGDADQYPGGGGPALAMKTVQQNLGISINYYAAVNFRAFVDTINYLGCIPIDVAQDIEDPNYPAPTGPGYDPFYLEAGEYCMGGETLLKYARTRATFGGDFDRAKRQQQVLYAIRDHVLSTGQLPTLLAQAPEIYDTIQTNVNTNLTERQLIDLVRVAADIPAENICSAVISGEYVERLETLPDGSQVVIPDRARIRDLVTDIYTGTGRCDPAAQDLEAAAQEEGAVITVLNGTRREGLATETADLLASAGLTLDTVGNADRFDYADTVIYNYNGKDATARYLARLLNVPESAIVVPGESSALYDIQIILGEDFQP